MNLSTDLVVRNVFFTLLDVVAAHNLRFTHRVIGLPSKEVNSL
jgi:hypothetical protein